MSSVISFSPESAYAGEAVIVVGSNFIGATSVKFGGINAASFVAVDDNNMIAVVAAGGATGDIEVQGTEGLGSNEGFTFLGVRPGVVKVKMPNSPPYPDNTAPTGDDLVWVTDTSTNVLRKAKISTLPFTGGGDDPTTVTSVPSPFFVFPGSDNYHYDEETNSVTIRDARLLNKINYPVGTTQLGGGEFVDNVITYNAVDPDDDTLGNVVISNFQLDGNSHVTITVPGDRDTSSDAVYAQLLADVKLLKQIAFPFIPTALGARGGKTWYTGAIADLAGTGWVEDETMRGMYPIHRDADDEDFSAAIGTEIGDSEIEIEMENLPAEGIPIKYIKGNSYGGGGHSGAVQFIDKDVVAPGGSDQTVQTGTTPNIGEGTPIKNIPKSMVGIWIKFIGIA